MLRRSSFRAHPHTHGSRGSCWNQTPRTVPSLQLWASSQAMSAPLVCELCFRGWVLARVSFLPLTLALSALSLSAVPVDNADLSKDLHTSCQCLPPEQKWEHRGGSLSPSSSSLLRNRFTAAKKGCNALQCESSAHLHAVVETYLWGWSRCLSIPTAGNKLPLQWLLDIIRNDGSKSTSGK